jgi:hypothetical protein
MGSIFELIVYRLIGVFCLHNCVMSFNLASFSKILHCASVCFIIIGNLAWDCYEVLWIGSLVWVLDFLYVVFSLVFPLCFCYG